MSNLPELESENIKPKSLLCEQMLENFGMINQRLLLLSSEAPEDINGDFRLPLEGTIIVRGQPYQYDFSKSRTLRIVGISRTQDPLAYIYEHIEFWISQLPLGERLLIRSDGWRALWAEGIPKGDRSNFHLIARDRLIKAIREQPTEVVFSLEVLAPTVNRPTDCCLSFGYCGWGWNPAIVAGAAEMSEFEAAIAEGYAQHAIERRLGTAESLKEAHERANGITFPT